MSDLQASVREYIENEATQLWWPGLAVILAGERGARMAFAPQDYSTTRFLELASPLKVVNTESEIAADHLRLRLEVMEDSLNVRFADRGLKFVDADEVTRDIGHAVCAATALICQTPSLAEAVGALVRSVHILKSDHPGFDVSFSDPLIPFSVFLSVPKGDQADLRIAEALVHESMHLQLSLVEEVLPLVQSAQTTRYSPWKQAHRPLSGVMHALYVFRVIDNWLRRIAHLHSDPFAVARRRAQIAEEVSELDLTGDEIGFTPEGKNLVLRLLR